MKNIRLDKKHLFSLEEMTRPTTCEVCKKPIWNLEKQCEVCRGVFNLMWADNGKVSGCDYRVHPGCKAFVPDNCPHQSSSGKATSRSRPATVRGEEGETVTHVLQSRRILSPTLCKFCQQLIVHPKGKQNCDTCSTLVMKCVSCGWVFHKHCLNLVSGQTCGTLIQGDVRTSPFVS